jgi:hypothetical protein
MTNRFQKLWRIHDDMARRPAKHFAVESRMQMKMAKAYIQSLPVLNPNATALSVAAYLDCNGATFADYIGKTLLSPLPCRLKEPACLYVFETIEPGVFKFGISKDPTLRAKRCKRSEKPLYDKPMLNIQCVDRQQAISFEQAILELNVELDAIPLQQDLRRFFKSTELTSIKPCMLKEIINGYFADWQSLGSQSFLFHHCSGALSMLGETIEQLTSGNLLPAISCDNRPRKIKLVEKHFCEINSYKYSEYMAIEWSKIG